MTEPDTGAPDAARDLTRGSVVKGPAWALPVIVASVDAAPMPASSAPGEADLL